MENEKELLEMRNLLELQEIRNILIEKLITGEEWKTRMHSRIDKLNADENYKEKLKERYNYVGISPR
ncbi:hypothetical protein LGL55_10520 [Clostridium tagluense]|uniref:hypothetical protein n=1 Tax=Clostridium tagluense TaxID=360422 RepID=UPI001CF2B95D|nr:hypothetical protein [Clostridium tagluense]MCB2311627.1 hypothetical protein [Clostridium tagluense]MCB2316351.1 hypothetical protein [Clostridium tagluense]MCB2321265.1 hypothetical protein [Clostridium tagluense]MCB2326220.1 hypothetical protein [Clostridium tagluense]MCB2331001.1 hypothetical protein [Clostridium tagluense]